MKEKVLALYFKYVSKLWVYGACNGKCWPINMAFHLGYNCKTCKCRDCRFLGNKTMAACWVFTHKEE